MDATEQDHKEQLVQELTKQLGEKNAEIRKLNFFVDSAAIALNLAVKEIQELRKKNG